MLTGGRSARIASKGEGERGRPLIFTAQRPSCARFTRLPVKPKARVVLVTSFSVCEKTEKMVNVLKGVLVECDPAMKQFLLYLDESNALGKKFIIQDLDETHVFVLAELVNFLQERVGELMDQNSFPITQK